ncbi:hypothetical protein COV49_01495 [Candidatus Falkowbacteria bacterium CG11_big_fil_rev_8_21_14_0_20_39_10]|uniref:Heat-inducible transcription repressor HrcA C-terminal domain-containing protein n=1 Tax=Candidatus Falkowbacteria bacterium CG11_big_fil_rev_8_21_14_0_20_39_10 TaxID=1974570 RepID=A0A2M6K9S7_9BACT|nr:MAG: hypothetical protein COV49_01495 [Candidatus Falkowbacteria bacterium CG11_big_fil_rev_8_21_14_0_20_39_10]
MNSRKDLILDTIIKEHIKTGAPVGSGVLVDKYKLNISPATVRNEMADLEEEGLIVQPHTSAGRIPTEEAYKLYIKKITDKSLGKEEKKILEKAIKNNQEENLKQVAKAISQISDSAVFWAFHRRNLYYTGISNLFQQPEFRELNLIYDISAVIDRIDEIIDGLFPKVKEGEHILIGSDSPFGDFCSTVMAKYKLGDNIGLFGIVGPIRMDYEKNIGIVNFIFKQLQG